MKSSFWLLFFALNTYSLAQTIPQGRSASTAPLQAPTQLTQLFTLAPGVRAATFSVPSDVNSDLPATSSSPTQQDPADLTSPAKPPEPNQTKTRIRWRQANGEAFLATGIDHTFNLWTEAGTRDALYGPWARQWLQSVSELRGWSDSDRFMAPYVGHTIQGSIYGFILRQNDPRYHDVQWGDGREYFMSLLRSMGFSAVWHTQWKIGPISEDSIGNVMLHASPGFITLVDTPTLGTVDMLAEDAADRYLIMGLENRTANEPLLVVARCFLNPGRSFANMMAFRQPWARATRMGIFGQNHLVRQQMVYDYKHNGGPKPFEFLRRQPVTPESESGHIFPKVAAIEVSAYPNFERIGGRNCIGGGGSGAARLSPSWQIVSEVNGCLIMGFSKYTQQRRFPFLWSGSALDSAGRPSLVAVC